METDYYKLDVMRNNIVLILGMCLISVAVSCTGKSAGEPETGVGRGLAEQRKAGIKELLYHLKFIIPEEKSEAVDGIVKISFRQDEVKPVILDFREEPEKVKNVRVNGQEQNVVFVNEHIVVPETQLIAGKNEIEIEFIAGDQSLNRNDEYLYTLLVPERARTLFPCFDQPDLKAVFSLELDLPQTWVAVANGQVVKEETQGGRKQMRFAETKPLSTYLFSFVAGKWQKAMKKRNGRTIAFYYRETDPVKIAQIDTIMDMVYTSLDWLEEYTQIPYPFEKYDLVVVPGFQFGGMEHAGAVLYNDKRMFLGASPSVAEELGRMELIAHETAHMWFGDAVTMAWFDDVWTKEVFANYFAARMTEPQFPQVNHRLNDLRNFYVSAYSEDRTAGSTSIKQPLENLKDAGLIYGQIVYDKAPIVMKKLVKLMGEESFRKGIQEYLNTYLYSNATWEGLITILDKYTSHDLAGWSHVWVNEKGMPEISVGQKGGNGEYTVTQHDFWERELIWPQQLKMLLVKNNGPEVAEEEILEVPLSAPIHNFTVPEGVQYILPNMDGEAYGYCVLDARTSEFCMNHLSGFKNPQLRLSVIMSLYENCLNNHIDPLILADTLIRHLKNETEPLIISTVMGYIKFLALHGSAAGSPGIEKGLLELSRTPAGPGCQQAAFRALLGVFALPETTAEIYRIWKTQKPYAGLSLSESDYMKMAYELAIRMPEQYEELYSIQSQRIGDPDRQKEFGFIARAVVPETGSRDSLFSSLLIPENRRIEPWVTQVMYYLNHPLRQKESVKYILPALEELQEVQRTGDIFFPKNWVSACLGGHNSIEAASVVEDFLREHTDYPVLLKNKILQSADPLFRLKD